jgi:hypothetical protein
LSFSKFLRRPIADERKWISRDLKLGRGYGNTDSDFLEEKPGTNSSRAVSDEPPQGPRDGAPFGSR